VLQLPNHTRAHYQTVGGNHPVDGSKNLVGSRSFLNPTHLLLTCVCVMYVCVHACVCVYYVCMSVCNIRVYVCMYYLCNTRLCVCNVCMYVCMHVCVCILRACVCM